MVKNAADKKFAFRSRLPEAAYQGAVMLLLTLAAAAILLPLLHILFASVSDPAWVRNYKGIILFPRGLTLDGYSLVFQNKAILTALGNTLIYVAGGSALSMALSVAGAYVLSVRGARLVPVFMKIIVVTMFFSGGIIPLYRLLDDLSMLNTRWAIIIPTAISAWNMIILRTAFLSVPQALKEAAEIDGASHIVVMLRVVVPVSMPTIAIVLMYYVSAIWNDWFTAMAFLISARELHPLQLILKELLVMNDTSNIIPGNPDTSTGMDVKVLVQYCTAVISTLPMLIFFPFVQKYFTTGLMLGSIKG